MKGGINNSYNIYIMKKIVLLLFVVIFVTSCYEDYRVDYSYTTVAFSTADGDSGSNEELWRTVVKDEGLNLDFGVYLAGVINNNEERYISYEIDNSLLEGTSYELLPADYYSLSNPNEFIIPSGDILGKINIELDSTKFLDDPLTADLHYALPLRLTESNADSILEGQNTKLLVLKYINKYHGYYNQKASYTTFNPDGTELNSGEIENVINATTVEKDRFLTDGMIFKGDDYMMSVNPSDNENVSLEYYPNPNPDNAPKNIAITDEDVQLSTSYVSGWESLEAIKDGYDPSSSTDKGDGAYGNWPNDDVWNWVQYDFGENVYNISLSQIYWWTDNGGILIPYDAYIEYWDLETEAWVRSEDPVGTDANKYNDTELSVSTNKIRMNFVATASQGILEWKVWGTPVPSVEEQSAVESVTLLTEKENSYDQENSTFTLHYRIDYAYYDFYTVVSSQLVWRNRVRDGVNEWRR